MTLFTENPLKKKGPHHPPGGGGRAPPPFQNPRRVCVALIRRNPPVSAIV